MVLSRVDFGQGLPQDVGQLQQREVWPDFALIRTQAAIEGIELFKRKEGVQAIKFDRGGEPRICTFRLSADELSLSWLTYVATRSIALGDVVDLLVGHDAAIYQVWPA